MKVLIIDDEQMILDMYSESLKGAGFEVICATDGQTGISLAQEQAPDVILLDIIMPKYNGLDVLRDLRANDKTKDIKVYLLTNLPKEASGEKAQQLGASGYLVKAENEPEMVVQLLKGINKNSTSPEPPAQ